MTRQIYLHNCGECGGETTNLSLICNTCAPAYAPSYDEPLRGDLTDDVDPDSREEPA